MISKVRPSLGYLVSVVGFFVIQRLVFPAPFGVVLQGALVGSLSALIAIGIALIWRANRALSLAQADLGLVPASLAVLLMSVNNVPLWLAFVIGIATAAALGGLVETVFVRRFKNSPRLILSVATIGISQLLAAAALGLPLLFGNEVPPGKYPEILPWRLNVSPIQFSGTDLATFVAVPLVMFALWLLLNKTGLGFSIRACAENAELAKLRGIDVERVNLVVWVLAAILAFIAMFLRAGVVGLPIGTVLGPALLLRALAAAVIGEMEKFTRITVSAILLGVLEQVTYWKYGSLNPSNPIIFGLLIVALLLLRSKASQRLDRGEVSSWQSVAPVRPISKELRDLGVVRWAGRAMTVSSVALLALLPIFLSAARQNQARLVMIYAILGISLVVLMGWAGQVSLGHMAFAASGSAVTGYLLTKGISVSIAGHKPLAGSWDPTIAVLGAAVVGAVVATLIGLPALRSRGMQLAVITLAFALATSEYFLNPSESHWFPTDRIAANP